MWSIIMTEFEKIKRCQILLIGIIGLPLCPAVQHVTQLISIPEARAPHYDFTVLLNNTIWGNATIFMPLIFTLTGGYLMNREFTDDTLKNLLVIPVSYARLLAGKLAAVGLLSIVCGFYSFTATVILGAAVRLPGMTPAVLGTALCRFTISSVLIYIAVLPLVAACGQRRDGYMAGAILAFVMGYSSMFFKQGLLRSIYPFLAAFTVMGFDTSGYIAARENENLPLAIASLTIMLLLALGITVLAKTPEAGKENGKKNGAFPGHGRGRSRAVRNR